MIAPALLRLASMPWPKAPADVVLDQLLDGLAGRSMESSQPGCVSSQSAAAEAQPLLPSRLSSRMAIGRGAGGAGMATGARRSAPRSRTPSRPRAGRSGRASRRRPRTSRIGVAEDDREDRPDRPAPPPCCAAAGACSARAHPPALTKPLVCLASKMAPLSSTTPSSVHLRQRNSLQVSCLPASSTGLPLSLSYHWRLNSSVQQPSTTEKPAAEVLGFNLAALLLPQAEYPFVESPTG